VISNRFRLLERFKLWKLKQTGAALAEMRIGSQFSDSKIKKLLTFVEAFRPSGWNG